MPSAKQQILKITNRKYGLNVQADALSYLEDVVQAFGDVNLVEIVDMIAQAFLQQKGTI